MKTSKDSHSALIIFAKAPIPGQVKTRLCPPLIPDEAATLQGSMVLDTMERSRTSKEFDRFLACAPSRDHPFFKVLATRHHVQLWDQKGENLGSRMDHAFQTAFHAGYHRVILIGTDLPSLQASMLKQASALLANHDLVLGPTVDGGYYLIGLKKPAPELFVDIPWSTNRVFAQSQEKAQSLGITSVCLAEQRDVDTVDDLQAFIKKVNGPEKGTVSTRTAGVLRTLEKRLRNM